MGALMVAMTRENQIDLFLRRDYGAHGKVGDVARWPCKGTLDFCSTFEKFSVVADWGGCAV